MYNYFLLMQKDFISLACIIILQKGIMISFHMYEHDIQ